MKSKSVPQWKTYNKRKKLKKWDYLIERNKRNQNKRSVP